MFFFFDLNLTHVFGHCERMNLALGAELEFSCRRFL